MKTCGFLSADDLSDFVTDDELAIEPLAARDWRVESVSWRAPVDWGRFDAVVVRSTWDYQRAPGEFLAVLERIDASRARLANDLDVMRWNMTKSYLRELEQSGVAIPHTLWLERLAPGDLERLFVELGEDELVIKPLVSANADHTYRLTPGQAARDEAMLIEVFAHRACMVQPFLPEIAADGEFSVILFHGEPSHAIRKVPRAGDFRVQEEHGGLITRVDPEAPLLDAAQRALAAVPAAPLYARADFVRTAAHGYLLMELELIEPSLYLRMDAGAPARFADALVRWMAEVPA